MKTQLKKQQSDGSAGANIKQKMLTEIDSGIADTRGEDCASNPPKDRFLQFWNGCRHQTHAEKCHRGMSAWKRLPMVNFEVFDVSDGEKFGFNGAWGVKVILD